MKWDAWGDPAAAKPLSDGVRSLLKQVVGLADSEQPELDPAQVQLRPSALSGADHDALARIVGTEYFRTADRDRLLHAGGKSTPDLLRRKDTGVQDAPDAVLLPGGPNGEDAVADILHYCSDPALPWSRLVAAPASLVGLTPFATTFAR
ncbi:flavoprotein [Mycobacterium tuberculosis]|nr:flavoprotein [Mycobacterium tuberculosis]